MTPLPPELIAAAQAEPEADAPRLACADWLDEQGDAEWAELIRVQCALARPDPLRKRPETARLKACEAARLKAMRKRALALAGKKASVGTGGLGLEWGRGFVTSLLWQLPVDESLWRLFPLLPLATVFYVSGTGGAAAADLARLSGLRLLARLVLTVGGTKTLTDADVAPLADLPRLDTIRLTAPRSWHSLIPEDVAGRLRAERDRRAAAIDPAARLEALRALCESLDVTPAGDVWATVWHLNPAELARRDELLAAVPNVRGVASEWADAPATLDRLAGLRSLITPHNVPEAGRPARLGDLRELHAPDGPGLLAWAAGQPRLRVCSLDSQFDATADLSPLAGHEALRVLDAPLSAWRDGDVFPDVVELSTNQPIEDAGALRAAFPSLRCLTLLGRLAKAVAQKLAAAGVYVSPGPGRATAAVPRDWSYWPRESFGEVSLCVPPWFRREPTPPPDPRMPDVAPLARWREWGDPDGSDDDLLLGPVVLRLERLHRRVKHTERRSTLLEPTTPFPVARFGGLHDVTPEGGVRHFEVETADARDRACRRYLWAEGASAVRLVARFAGRRGPHLGDWVGRVAESLRRE